MSEAWKEASWVREGIAGLTAGSVSTICVHPLDLVKTRLQSKVYWRNLPFSSDYEKSIPRSKYDLAHCTGSHWPRWQCSGAVSWSYTEPRWKCACLGIVFCILRSDQAGDARERRGCRSGISAVLYRVCSRWRRLGAMYESYMGRQDSNAIFNKGRHARCLSQSFGWLSEDCAARRIAWPLSRIASIPVGRLARRCSVYGLRKAETMETQHKLSGFG